MPFLASLLAVVVGLSIGLPWLWWQHRDEEPEDGVDGETEDGVDGEPVIHFEPPQDRESFDS